MFPQHQEVERSLSETRGTAKSDKFVFEQSERF